MANINQNAMPTEANMILMVCILINGKEILLQALHHEEVAKGVLMDWMNVEPKGMQTLNKTTFLVTYAPGILAEEIGTAIEKIDNSLGEPVVITCDEVTTAQLPHVLECAQHITGVEMVTFNHRMDALHSNLLQSVNSDYQSQMTSPMHQGL